MSIERTRLILRYSQMLVALLLLAALVAALGLRLIDSEALPDWVAAVVGILIGWLGAKRPTEMLRQ